MFIYLLLVLNITFRVVSSIHNVTVDDADLSIVYTPPASWTTSANNGLNIGGAHKLTQDMNANASFTFTGLQFHYLLPLAFD